MAVAPAAAGGGSMTAALARDIRPALDLIDGLRMSGVDRDLAIPQICVVGDQSSGKSSVLEAICGVPFPRGAGLTTRCATELHLSDGRARRPSKSAGGGEVTDPSSPGGESDVEWAAVVSTSVDQRPVRVSNADELGDAIVARTASLTDERRNGGFSKEKIIIRMMAKDLPNLTLIDLPGCGLARLTCLGVTQYYSNEDAQVRDLIQSYMQQERTIVLVVVPCTQDVATNEALEWANRYDPSGERTIGVMTKPDLVDRGAEDEVVKVLTNQRKPLTLGYVMVRNRSQMEVNENISAAETRRREMAFFESSPVYSKVDRKLLGVEQLTKKLTSILVTRIHAALPSMRSEILAKLDRTTAELKELGRGAGESDQEANLTLVRLVFDYHNLLQDTSAGRYVDKRLWDSKVRLCTRIQSLYDEFKDNITSTKPTFEGSIVGEIEKEIRDSRGRELPGFLNPRIFESRVARFVDDWKSSSNQLVVGARKTISEVTSELFRTLAPEFSMLQNRVHEIVEGAIKELEIDTRKEIDNVFAREAEAFTMNDQFLEAVNRKRLERFDQAALAALASAGRADSRNQSREKEFATLMRKWYQKQYCASASERVRADAEDMVVMLSVYWDVASRRFIDSLVMSIEGSMIRPLANSVHVPLNGMVMRAGKAEEGGGGDSIAQLMREDTSTIAKRRELVARERRLKQARDLIDRF